MSEAGVGSAMLLPSQVVGLSYCGYSHSHKELTSISQQANSCCLRHQMSPLPGSVAREREGSYRRKVQNTNLLFVLLIPGPFIAWGSMENVHVVCSSFT